MLTFTKSMLALSVMAAVGGANAATYTEDTTLTDKTLWLSAVQP